MKRTTKPNPDAPRGPTARKLAAARRELRLLLQVAQYFANGTTKNETVIERVNAALDALR